MQKTFEGFKTRVLAKITALTIVQFINKNYLNKKNQQSKVKHILKCTTGYFINCPTVFCFCTFISSSLNLKDYTPVLLPYSIFSISFFKTLIFL